MTRQVSRTPVRYPSGVNNSLSGANPGTAWRMYGDADSTRYQKYENDFMTYVAGDWTITDVGTDTTALTDGDGGQITITTGAAGTDSRFHQLPKLMFYPEAGKQMWFEAKIKADSATLSNIVIGLQAQDTTPLAVSDGIYFIKASGAATYDFIVKAENVATTASAAGSIAAATFLRLGFYYNGSDAVEYFADNVKLGSLAITNLPSAGLTLSFGLAASTAVARTLVVDYIACVKERLTPNAP